MKAWGVLLVVFVCAGLLLAQEQPVGQPMPVSWGQVKGMSADFPGFQAGAPLQVIATQLAKLDLLNGVFLVNVSERTIVKYRLGWVVTDRDHPGRGGTVFLGQPFDAIIEPWEVEEAGRQGANFSDVIEDLNSRQIEFGKVIVGVVYVKFKDGSEWSYPLKERRQFLSEANPALHQKIDPILTRIMKRIDERQKQPSSQP